MQTRAHRQRITSLVSSGEARLMYRTVYWKWAFPDVKGNEGPAVTLLVPRNPMGCPGAAELGFPSLLGTSGGILNKPPFLPLKHNQ